MHFYPAPCWFYRYWGIDGQCVGHVHDDCALAIGREYGPTPKKKMDTHNYWNNLFPLQVQSRMKIMHYVHKWRVWKTEQFYERKSTCEYVQSYSSEMETVLPAVKFGLQEHNYTKEHLADTFITCFLSTFQQRINEEKQACPNLCTRKVRLSISFQKTAKDTLYFR